MELTVITPLCHRTPERNPPNSVSINRSLPRPSSLSPPLGTPCCSVLCKFSSWMSEVTGACLSVPGLFCIVTSRAICVFHIHRLSSHVTESYSSVCAMFPLPPSQLLPPTVLPQTLCLLALEDRFLCVASTFSLFMDWGHGSSHRAPAYQSQSPEFKSKYRQKGKNCVFSLLRDLHTVLPVFTALIPTSSVVRVAISLHCGQNLSLYLQSILSSIHWSCKGIHCDISDMLTVHVA
jgi:hypothetical protein